MKHTTLFKKITACFVAGLTTIGLLLVLGNSGTLTWFPPAIVFSLVGIVFLGSLIFPFIWHTQEKKLRFNSERTYGIVYSIIRYTIAFNLAGFGWKKLLGLQFVVPEEISSKPMNQQSGEWLTWYYFGHSYAFGIILAMIQIGGSYLLLFRRTMLLGATILFAFMFNLALINIFYQMNAGALLQSVLLTMGVAFLILLDYEKLVSFYLKTKSSIPSITLNTLTKNLLRLSAIILSLLFTIYLKSLMR